MPKQNKTKEMEDSTRYRKRLALLYRYTVAAIVCWVLIVAASLIWNIQHEKESIESMAKNEALSSFKRDEAFRLFIASRGGVYVPLDNKTPSNPYLNHPERDITTTSGKNLTLMNAAYFFHKVMEEYGQVTGVNWRLTSLKPINPANTPDEWEQKTLRAFEQQAEIMIGFSDFKGKPYLRLLSPMATVESCLKCHAYQGYKVGEIRGAMGVYLPMATYLMHQHKATRELIWTHVIIALVGLAGIVVTSTNIRTHIIENIRAEEALRETNDYLENLFNYANAPIIVWDPQFKITRFNHTFESLTGRSADEVIGKTVDILFPPALVESSMDLIKKTQSGERWETIEISILHVNGTMRTVLWNSATLFTPDRKTPVATIAQGQDITERKQMVEALAIQTRIATIFLTAPDDEMFNEVLKVILDIMQSPFGVFGFIDETGALVVPTMTRQIWDKCQVPEKTTVFPRETWGDSSWPTAIREKRTIYTNEPSAGIPNGHVDIQRHISMPILFQGEVVGLFQVANKKTNYTETDIRTLADIAGHVASILNARLQRSRAEQQRDLAMVDLQRSNKELEQFAYVASHDLQEPLRMVASYTQLLAERYENQLDDKAKKFIHYAVDGAVRMQLLINDLLVYSRIGTRGKPLEPTDGHAVLGEAINNLKMNIDKAKAIITNDELPGVRADASQLVQLFQNLIGNAVKFRGEKHPHVHISARDEGREWLFSVRDNGIGIDPQYADKVFVIFQRLNTKEEYPGSGIGLAICKKIVERHGGRIWFESVPGQNTIFYFTIPK